MESIPVKACTKCQTEYPAITQHFRKIGKYLQSWCRPCERTYAKIYKQSKTESGEMAASLQAYRAANPGKAFQWHQDYNLANREKLRQQDTVYRAANSEKIRQQAKDRYRANPEKAQEKNAKRRARRLSVPGSCHTAADIRIQLKSQKGKCYWCGKKLSGYHVDHRIAFALGGGNGPDNIVCACPTCNLKKGAKTPWDFAGRLL